MSKMKRKSKDVICGVYKIENMVNSKCYIGSSFDIYGRWVQHKRDLMSMRHHSAKLQNSWNKHGEQSFRFEIVEMVETDDRDELFKLEDYHIESFDSFNNGYNMSKNAWAPMYSTTMKDIEDGKRTVSMEQFNEIIYYLSKTKISIPEISKITNVKSGTIYQIYFREQYVDLTEDYEFNKRKCGWDQKLDEEKVANIICRILNGDFYSDIAKDFGVERSTIDDIVNRKIWKNLTIDVEFPVISNRRRNKGKPILQYDKEMNFIDRYESARDAYAKTGIPYKAISRVCRGERPYTHGYIFMFESGDFEGEYIKTDIYYIN